MVLGKFIKYNFKVLAEYRINFFFTTVVMLAMNFTIYFPLIFTANQLTQLINTDSDFIIKGIILFQATYAIGISPFRQGFDNLEKMKISGELDTYLTKPMRFYKQILTRRINSYALAELITPLFFFLFLNTKEYSFLWYIIPGSILSNHIALILCTIPLFFQINQPTRLNTLFYTIDKPPMIYPKKILVYLLPALVIGYPFYFLDAGIINFWQLILMWVLPTIIAHPLLNLAMKKYESAGY